MSDLDTPPATVAATPPARTGRPVLPWAVAAMAILVAVSAVLWAVERAAPTAASKITVQGYVTVYRSGSVDQPCRGVDGYDYLAAGARLAIYDASNKLLAIGVLEPGVPSNPHVIFADCTFKFTIAGVEPGAGPYTLNIAGRGTVLFNESDAGNLQVAINQS